MKFLKAILITLLSFTFLLSGCSSPKNITVEVNKSSVPVPQDAKPVADSNNIKAIEFNKFRSLVKNYNVRFIRCSPDGKWLVTEGTSGIRVWDTSSWTEINSVPVLNESISGASFSKNGNILGVRTRDERVILINTNSWKIIRKFSEATNDLFNGKEAIALSPDGNILATGNMELVELFDVSSGRKIFSLKGHDYIKTISFSPNGKTIIAGTGNYVDIWNIETGNLIKTLSNHSGKIYSSSFSPDGKLLAIGSWDKTISIWQVDNWTLLDTLRGHDQGIESVDFFPDSNMLASSSQDNSVRIWDISLKKLVGVLPFKSTQPIVTRVQVSRDGKYLITGANTYDSLNSDTVIIWEIVK